MIFPIATTVEASAAALAMLTMIGGGIFGLGKLSSNIEANTNATERLADVIDKHITWSVEWTAKATDKFADHDKRITVLETKVNDD